MCYNSKINFLIAGAFCNFKKIVAHYVKNKNYKKYKSYNSITVYDGILNCQWNGGRPNDTTLLNLSEIDIQKEEYYKMGWGISLVFSNPKIDLSDETGLILLDKFHREGNGIILTNESLRQFLREKYPKYKLTYSITGGPGRGTLGDEEIKFYSEKIKLYDILVPRLEANLDSRLSELDVSKIEILLNDNCVYNCRHFREHYDSIAGVNEKQLQKILSKDEIERKVDCWLKVADSEKQIEIDKKIYGDSYGMMLSPSKIKTLVDKGIRHFKIQGRDKNTDPCIMDELDKYIVDYNLESI